MGLSWGQSQILGVQSSEGLTRAGGFVSKMALTWLTILVWPSEINKETRALNDKLDQMDLIDIFRTVHPNAEEYTFLLKCTWNILQDRLHLGSQIKPQ